MIFRLGRVFLLFVLQLFPLPVKVDSNVTIAVSFAAAFDVNSPQFSTVLQLSHSLLFSGRGHTNEFFIFSLKFENLFGGIFNICIHFMWLALSFMYKVHICFTASLGLWVISFARSGSPIAIQYFLPLFAFSCAVTP